MVDDVPVDIQYIILPTCFWIATFNRLPMANPESSDSPQAKLFHECGWEFHKGDRALVEKTLHKEFRYIPYPRSLGRPEQKKEEFLEYWAGTTSLWATPPEVSYICCSSNPFAVTKPPRRRTSVSL